MNFYECINKLRTAIAATSASSNISKNLIENCKQIRGLHGESILHYLAVENESEMVRFLLGLGFEIDETNKYGQTALFDVVKINNISMLNLLIEHGANISFADKEGNCPLHIAYSVFPFNQKIVDILVGHGACNKSMNIYGEFPEDLKISP